MYTRYVPTFYIRIPIFFSTYKVFYLKTKKIEKCIQSKDENIYKHVYISIIGFYEYISI